MARVSEAEHPKSSGVDKRAIILNSARALFRQHGYKRTSMDDIAREAGVAKGTLYIYFTSKEQLFNAISAEFDAMMLEQLRHAAALDLPLVEKIIALMDVRIGNVLRWKAATPNADDLISAHERMKFGRSEAVSQEFRDLLAKVLKDGIRQGEVDPKAAGLTFETAVETLIFSAAGAAALEATPKLFLERLGRIVRLALRGMKA